MVLPSTIAKAAIIWQDRRWLGRVARVEGFVHVSILPGPREFALCFCSKINQIDPRGRIERRRIQTEDMAAALSYNLPGRVCTATALLLLLILSHVAPGQPIAIGETIWYVLGERGWLLRLSSGPTEPSFG
jgi:hypothetical protein